FLAKVASDINKPDGITLIPPDRAEAFLEKLSIEKFFGIGKKTAEKMRRMGIRNGADLKRYSELELAKRFGKVGRHYFRIVRAIDNRSVKPDRPRKSIGIENTYSYDLTEEADMLEKLQELSEKLAGWVERVDSGGKTITLKIKYHDFVQTTRSKTVSFYIRTFEEMFPLVQLLLHQPAFPEKSVRLLGVYLSNLNKEDDAYPRQLTLEF
ncbi:MAG: DNA polymerase IV, partial [Bacteroidota bacterium]